MEYVTATLLTIALSAILAKSAAASPTMIRLGYAGCASCHLSPQGAGLLTSYGKGIDEAQSLRAEAAMISTMLRSAVQRSRTFTVQVAVKSIQ